MEEADVPGIKYPSIERFICLAVPRAARRRRESSRFYAGKSWLEDESFTLSLNMMEQIDVTCETI